MRALSKPIRITVVPLAAVACLILAGCGSSSSSSPPASSGGASSGGASSGGASSGGASSGGASSGGASSGGASSGSGEGTVQGSPSFNDANLAKLQASITKGDLSWGW